MSAAGYPFQMVGGVPVVRTPAEIDTTTAGELRAILLEWQSRGHTTIVVNMTSTQYCDPAVEATALTWSIAAMSEATARLPAVKVWDLPQAFAAIREAVWWTTMVDATLVRHRQGVYSAVMAAHAPDERRLIEETLEETLAGLRFVRNWSSREAWLGDVIETGIATGASPVGRGSRSLSRCSPGFRAAHRHGN